MKEFDAGLIALGAALNVSIGYLVGLLKLPLYLDSIGTILISALCGWMYGIVVGFAALIILALTATPTVIAYAGTVVVVAVLSDAFARVGFLRRTWMTIFGGIFLGLAAAASSTPVTTFLYGGVSLAGADAITTFFKATGMPLWKSVLLGSLVTDPADKLITSLICLGLIKSLPPRILERMKKRESFN
jgi:energy-coupling factor transport system substrate-specific component